MVENIVERILNTLNDDKALDMHDQINDQLLKYQDKGWIDDDERDALRHYYTIQGLSSKYGETIAWLSGIIHEDFGVELLYPEDSEEYKSTKADLYNNNVALKMFSKSPNKEYILQNLFLAPDAEFLKIPLQFLKTSKDFAVKKENIPLKKSDMFLYEHLKEFDE